MIQESLPFDNITPKEYLLRCRTLAEDIARREGTVAMSDIHKIYQRPMHISCNVDGSVFRRNKKFKMIGSRESLTGTRKKGLERVWGLI